MLFETQTTGERKGGCQQPTVHDAATFAPQPTPNRKLRADELGACGPHAPRSRFTPTARGRGTTTRSMPIPDTGSVGIAPPPPAAKLHISDNSGHVLLG